MRSTPERASDRTNEHDASSMMDNLGVAESSTANRPTRPWCLFHCGSASYAFGLESVAEAVEVECLVRLPQSPPRVLGMCTLRREVVPVIGLDRHDGELSLHDAAMSKVLVLILRSARGTWAVRINAEGTVVAEEPLEETAPAGDCDGLAFLGTVRRGDAGYAIIDPETTWRNVRQSVENWYCEHPGRDTAAKGQGQASTLAAPSAR
jgi:chemotaxis signal transduction protein